MSDSKPNAIDSAQRDLVKTLDEVIPVQTTKRGRPSRRTIEQMINAPKNMLLDSGGVSGKRRSVGGAAIETAIGVGSLLNLEKKIVLLSLSTPGAKFAKADPDIKSSGHPINTRFSDTFQRILDAVQFELSNGHDYFGFVEPQALLALGVTGATVKSFVRRKADYDVYFTNIAIRSECLYENSWAYGESLYPGYADFSQQCLIQGGLELETIRTVTPSGSLGCFALVIANPRFWSDFLAFAKAFAPAVHRQSESMHHEEFSIFSSLFADSLLSEFLVRASSHRSFKFKSNLLEKELNPYLFQLRTMKDLACKSKSQWLLGCWENYKYLYQSFVKHAEGAPEELAAKPIGNFLLP